MRRFLLIVPLVALLAGSVPVHSQDLVTRPAFELFRIAAHFGRHPRPGGRNHRTRRRRLGAGPRLAGCRASRRGADRHAVSSRRPDTNHHRHAGPALRRRRALVPRRSDWPVQAGQPRCERHDPADPHAHVRLTRQPAVCLPPGTSRAAVARDPRLYRRLVSRNGREAARSPGDDRLRPRAGYRPSGNADRGHPDAHRPRTLRHALERLAVPYAVDRTAVPRSRLTRRRR